MDDLNKIQEAVVRLIQAKISGISCEPVRELIGEDDIRLAYEVQSIISEKKVMQGARIIGAKVGLTSEAVQAQFGIDQPDFGLLFNDMHVINNANVPWNVLSQPRIESEIAFVMGKDLTGAVPTEMELKESIAYISTALEIVGSRIRDWDIKITDTIADNASASHFVLGEEQVPFDEVDLESCEMTMSKNGTLCSTGKGSDCLGSPMNALLWLAIKMAHLGMPLKKGDIILSGALGPMVKVEPGDKFETSISGVGSCTVSFNELD